MKRFLAWLCGYFYLPCPSCGRMFAGWECGYRTVLRDGRGMVVCRRCD